MTIAHTPDQQESMESCGQIEVLVLARTADGWMRVRSADDLGLTQQDLDELAAEECGLIPTAADRQHAEDWWDEEEDRAQLAIEAYYEAGRND